MFVGGGSRISHVVYTLLVNMFATLRVTLLHAFVRLAVYRVYRGGLVSNYYQSMLISSSQAFVCVAGGEDRDVGIAQFRLFLSVL
ncbi:hypothetical protein HBI56_125710 [Parastagonospora nodorum]|nr:hypothetical protein HBH53_104940 [Parastagonospora nodorum]KAH3968770.1 hypothetical protein HBH51_128840 [Parastagonospora nodorum]KAH3989683.1 hypothetical protein HBH52_013130 [Parastagonospora nodorum]KAH3997283.1 hypothetical protein HBI10_146700 [Parastagonospora nodorum]KAH4019937.1 hypothetical protein HBI13_119850 [Parastagonospora nodorum]